MRGLQPGFVVYDHDGGDHDNDDGEEKEEEEEGRGDETHEQQGLPSGVDVAQFNGFFDPIVAMEAKWHAGDKLVLSHLCTLRTHRGRGLGAALLRAVLALADAEADAVPSLLMSLRPAAPLYERHGYAVVDRIEYGGGTSGGGTDGGTGTGPVIDVMLREPRPVVQEEGEGGGGGEGSG
ncbi:hypothetical protein GGR56DRAFT_632444 [Xylariaceae sp. FL0804]|nr:hypothetical protein GGR56DRAFT_632444 [Xylariaceae sp. FL0804]